MEITKTTRKMKMSKPKRSDPYIFALFNLNAALNSNDLHSEVGYMFCGLYSTMEKAKISFANLVIEQSPEIECEVFPNGPDAPPIVTNDLMKKHGFRILQSQVD